MATLSQSRPSVRLRAWLLLTGACMFATILVLPYQLAVLSQLPGVPATPLEWWLLPAAAGQAGVMFGACAALGLWLGPRVGLGFPGLERWLGGARDAHALRRPTAALPWGVGAALAIIGLSLAFPLPATSITAAPTWWQGLLAAFYGGIAEEVLVRLGVMTGLVWLFSRVWRERDGGVPRAAMWLGIVGAALLFGAGHLPVASLVYGLTPRIITTIVGLNAVAGVVFGWLYWRRGLGSAIAAHFAADIVLHVLTRLVD